MTPIFEQGGVTLYCGDCREVLRALPEKSVNCCVTSPPYWGLRSYGTQPQVWGGEEGCEHGWGTVERVGGGKQDGEGKRWQHTSGGVSGHGVARSDICSICGAWRGELGMEPTPEMFVEHMTDVFDEVSRVLRDDGTLWLNIGDSYHNGDKGGYAKDRVTAEDSLQKSNLGANFIGAPNRQPHPLLKSKDLVGVPWMLAFSLRKAGWFLRQDIIWNKSNPMPESVRDRCTKSHEYLFLLTKKPIYYCAMDRIAEAATADHEAGNNSHKGLTAYLEGDERHRTKAGLVAYAQKRKQRKPAGWDTGEGAHGAFHREGRAQEVEYTETEADTRNKRSVWSIPTAPFPDAHFATFPPKLIEPCILAGCPDGGLVLDPFCGAGTTPLVCQQQHVRCIGIELNPDYCGIITRRLAQQPLPFTEGAA